MKRRLQQALLVEGKYDAARLANLVEGIILTTDGFAVFKDAPMQDLLKRTARACGLVILTDSDAAGFKIRHFVTGLVGAQYAYQAFIPALPGKERRKVQPGKEGLLGVEGVPDELICRRWTLRWPGRGRRRKPMRRSGPSPTQTSTNGGCLAGRTARKNAAPSCGVWGCRRV